MKIFHVQILIIVALVSLMMITFVSLNNSAFPNQKSKILNHSHQSEIKKLYFNL